ncbi:hypothetical protein XELAEV_18007371mg [Xenopus laevis]|uniref:G-protein coupled receptors family 1 profile domain-containing protein n=1 Tax=Xenopus laevis TaxID=8355 RepID=A0A974E0L3_XENLA|nr:hypothetical protein XELAEV_18007371mg [Xenopus laevis]
MQQDNYTAVYEFLILGFHRLHGFNILLFLFFLLIYIVICLENLLIIVLVTISSRLQSPMYFILKCMSVCELCFATSVVPKMLHDILAEKAKISVIGCIVQLNIWGTMGMLIYLLYALMSYDRYVAISNPLRYSALIDNKLCLRLVIGFCFIFFLAAVLISVLLSKLDFCNRIIPAIDHFYCDFAPLMALSCSDTKLVQGVAALSSGIVILLSLFFVLFSYVFIIFKILAIPSATGRKKSFSTCSSHLIVVIINYGILINVYVSPDTVNSPQVNKGLSFIYILVTPLVNPIIYTLKNQEFNIALQAKAREIKMHFFL